MSREVYSSLSGAMATWKRLEVVADNLANSSTTGFRAGQTSFEAWGPHYVRFSEVRPDASVGTLRPTNTPTDLALDGPDAWFSVATGVGVRLTRDGHFHLDGDGRLVTAQGHSVLGDTGEIVVPPGETFQVGRDGTVTASQSGVVGRIHVVGAEAVAEGENLWRPAAALESVSVGVVQGSLEESNADPLHAMTELVEVSRWFEAFQKAMQASDELDARLNRVGGS